MSVIAGALALLLYLLVCYYVGRLTFAALQIRVDGLTRAGSVVIGASAMAIQLWIYGVIHIPWWTVFLLGPWVVAGVIFRRTVVEAVRSDAEALRQLTSALRELDPLTDGLASLTAVTAGYYLISLVAQPLIGWDAIAMWLFKAKVFFHAHSIDLSLIVSNETMRVDRHLDYPPFVPLMFDSFWVLLGRVNDSLAKGVIFVFLVAAVWAVTVLLLPLIGSRLTVLVALVLVAMPTLQTSFVFPYYMGYADYAVAALMVLSLAHLYRSSTLGGDQDSTLAVVYGSLAALSKNEGVPFLIIVLTVLGAAVAWRLIKHPQRPPVMLIVIGAVSVLPFLAWEIYVRLHGFNNSFLTQAHPSISSLPSRAREILVFYRHLMNRTDDYPWFVAAWLFTTVGVVVIRSPRLVLVWAIVTGQAAFYFLALLFSDVTYELITASDRLALQWSPLVVLLLGIALYELQPIRAPMRSESYPSAAGA